MIRGWDPPRDNKNEGPLCRRALAIQPSVAFDGLLPGSRRVRLWAYFLKTPPDTHAAASEVHALGCSPGRSTAVHMHEELSARPQCCSHGQRHSDMAQLSKCDVGRPVSTLMCSAGRKLAVHQAPSHVTLRAQALVGACLC